METDDNLIPLTDEETLAECWGRPIEPLTDDISEIHRQINE